MYRHQNDKCVSADFHRRKLFLFLIIMLFVARNGYTEADSTTIDNAALESTPTKHDIQATPDQQNQETMAMEKLEKDLKDTDVDRIGVDENSFDMPIFLEENPDFSWKDILHREENPIFAEGETLKYKVSWMGINAGTITMKLDVHSNYDDKAAYHVTVTGETNKAFSAFFKVRDVFTSIMEPETFNSIYYSKNVREGKYRKFQETHYDQVQRKASTGDHQHDLPPNSKDPIACIYAMRRFKPGDSTVIRMNSNSEGKSNFPVEIAFASAAPISLADGISRRALQGKPLPTWEGRIFEKRRSEVVFWLSDETIAVPLKLQIKVRIGSLHADLIGRSGPGWELNLEK